MTMLFDEVVEDIDRFSETEAIAPSRSGRRSSDGSVFLAFAILAEKKALVSDFRGSKSIYYLGGIAEGSGTIAFFAAFCLFPSAFPALAPVFGLICIVSAVARVRLGWSRLALSRPIALGGNTSEGSACYVSATGTSALP
jgi:hypothetical protein